MKNIEALERFTDVIISKIQNTSKDWTQPWFSCNKGMPRNINGRHYNASNAVMLLFACETFKYEHPVFLTFNQVQELNKGVRDDKHRIFIRHKQHSFPVILKSKYYKNEETGEFITPKAYDELSEEEQERYKELFVRKTFGVFNIQQTNMKEAQPETWRKVTLHKLKTTPAEGELLQSFEAMKMDGGWICPIIDDNDTTPLFNVTRNEIHIPHRNQFYNTERYYCTAFHECAHSTMVPTKRKTEDKAREELVAELTSALVCAQIGYNKAINEDCVPYLKSWLASLKESPDYIKTILDDVQKAENILQSKLEKYEKYYYIEIKEAA